MSQEPAPEVQGVPVTARNWQDPPVNRWAFWHVGDLLPTYRVPRGDGAPRPLPAAAARPDLLSVPVTRMDRTPGASSASTVGDVLADTYTDAYLVLQDGALVTEWYGPLGAPDRPHALMSVTKSVVGCVAAVLIDRGDLDPDAEVTAYVPELAGSGFAGALVRQIYDMRSGVRFLEEYANPDSDIRRLDEWVGWQPGSGMYAAIHVVIAALRRHDRGIVLGDDAVHRIVTARGCAAAAGDARGQEHVGPAARLRIGRCGCESRAGEKLRDEGTPARRGSRSGCRNRAHGISSGRPQRQMRATNRSRAAARRVRCASAGWRHAATRPPRPVPP